MDKKKAIETIVHLCDDEDGFLVQLRSRRMFQQDQYDELISAIRAYRDAIVEDQTIDRRVAGSLHNLILTLGDILTAFPHNEKERKLIEGAVAEFWQLVEELFTPDLYKLT